MKLKPLAKKQFLPPRLDKVIGEQFYYTRNEGTHKSLRVPFVVQQYIEQYLGCTEEALPPIHTIMRITGLLFGYLIESKYKGEFIFFIPKSSEEDKQFALFDIRQLAYNINLIDDAYAFNVVFIENIFEFPEKLDPSIFDACYFTGIKYRLDCEDSIRLIDSGIVRFNFLSTFVEVDPKILHDSFLAFTDLHSFWFSVNRNGIFSSSMVFKPVVKIEILIPLSVYDDELKEKSRALFNADKIVADGVTKTLFSRRIRIISLDPINGVIDRTDTVLCALFP